MPKKDANVKIAIGKDDFYPYYSISEDINYGNKRGDPIIKIPKGKLNWLKQVEKEFKEAQKYLKKLHD